MLDIDSGVITIVRRKVECSVCSLGQQSRSDTGKGAGDQTALLRIQEVDYVAVHIGLSSASCVINKTQPSISGLVLTDFKM